MWALEYIGAGEDGFRKLDASVKRAIEKYMAAVCKLQDPRARGKRLSGGLKGHHRYRVGDFRVICTIMEDRLLILAIDVGHRSSVYDD